MKSTGRRASPRYCVNIPSTISIASAEGLVCSETDSASLQDIGCDGTGIRVQFDISDDSANVEQVLARPKLAVVVCTLPGDNVQTRLTGKIVWFRVIRDIRKRIVRLGMSLKATPPEEMEGLWNYLARMEREPERVQSANGD